MQDRIAILAAVAISLALIGVSVALALDSGLFSAPRPETAGTLAPVLTPDPGTDPSGSTEPPSATSTPPAVHHVDEPEEDDVGEAGDPPHPEWRNDDD